MNISMPDIGKKLNLEQVTALLQTPKNIWITTHDRPDGDAMGSSLGLYHFLQQKGHQVRVVVPTEYPNFLNFLPSNDEVVTYEYQKKLGLQLLDEADIVFVLDFSALHRNEMGQQIAASKATKIMIDHHLDPEDFSHYQVWDTKASSASELIYEFIDLLNDTSLINHDIAACLYTGICADTGRFKYNLTPRTHRIAAELVVQNIDLDQIHRNLFENFSENRLRFIGHCLNRRLRVYEHHNTAIIYISSADTEKYRCRTGDTDGLVNYALGVVNVRFAILLKEHRNQRIIKISFRSNGDFSVKEFAEKHFQGGGHKNASGGRSNLSLQKTLEKVERLLDDYQEMLTA
ncbi:MAG: DHH family phosphoesterase [Chitinophagales bacterium]